MIHDLLSRGNSPRASHSKSHWNSVESVPLVAHNFADASVEAMPILGIIRVRYRGTPYDIHTTQSEQCTQSRASDKHGRIKMLGRITPFLHSSSPVSVKLRCSSNTVLLHCIDAESAPKLYPCPRGLSLALR